MTAIAGRTRNFRLARRIFNQRLAFGQCRSEKHVVGRAHGNFREDNVRAAQALWGAGKHVTSFDIDLGSECLETRKMQIDRPRANGAAAGKRNFGNTHTRDQRAQDPKARPHARHHFVGRRGIDDIAGGEMESFAEVG